MRIRPKKGEVDYQEVHAKARPGIQKDHDDNEDDDDDEGDDEDEDEDEVDLKSDIFRHHTIVGIFEQCRGH